MKGSTFHLQNNKCNFDDIRNTGSWCVSVCNSESVNGIFITVPSLSLEPLISCQKGSVDFRRWHKGGSSASLVSCLEMQL